MESSWQLDVSLRDRRHNLFALNITPTCPPLTTPQKKQVEQGTPFARWYGQEAGTQNSPLPQEPEAVAMFEAASATLAAAGYEHYEVGGCVCMRMLLMV